MMPADTIDISAVTAMILQRPDHSTLLTPRGALSDLSARAFTVRAIKPVTPPMADASGTEAATPTAVVATDPATLTPEQWATPRDRDAIRGLAKLIEYSSRVPDSILATTDATGEPRYRCGYGDCQIASSNPQFIEKHQLATDHFDATKTSIHCNVPGCDFTSKSQARQRMHVAKAHRDLIKRSYACSITGCESGPFKNRKVRAAHEKNKHGIRRAVGNGKLVTVGTPAEPVATPGAPTTTYACRAAGCIVDPFVKLRTRAYHEGQCHSLYLDPYGNPALARAERAESFRQARYAKRKTAETTVTTPVTKTARTVVASPAAAKVAPITVTTYYHCRAPVCIFKPFKDRAKRACHEGFYHNLYLDQNDNPVVEKALAVASVPPVSSSAE